MQMNLDAFTDVARFVIFDPTVVDSMTGDRDRLEDMIESATSTGSAIVYSYASDGEAAFRVLVNEPLPPKWVKRRQCGIEGARLRVPSGRIMAAGAEYVWPEVNTEHATEAAIPPGDYLVDAFDIEWDGVVLNKKLRAMVGVKNIRIANVLGVSIGFGFVCTLIGLCSILWSLFEQSWLPLKVAGVLVGGYWAILIPVLLLARWGKATERVGQAQDELAKEFPSTVLWLRPAEGVRNFNVGKFGMGYVEQAVKEDAVGRPVRGCMGSAVGLFVICFVIALIIALFTFWVSGTLS
ncbi:MAG: hypothetical protein IH984_06330 [Planctomycetes bacterium]|nr:hypothetical protein [Planctomycetota bacterium]